MSVGPPQWVSRDHFLGNRPRPPRHFPRGPPAPSRIPTITLAPIYGLFVADRAGNSDPPNDPPPTGPAP